MINKIIEFSMRNRWLVLAVYVALAAWGYWALLHTPIDAIPDLSENQVIVHRLARPQPTRGRRSDHIPVNGQHAGLARRANR
jgi:Cu/Ag efflux pump CusA